MCIEDVVVNGLRCLKIDGNMICVGDRLKIGNRVRATLRYGFAEIMDNECYGFNYVYGFYLECENDCSKYCHIDTLINGDYEIIGGE